MITNRINICNHTNLFGQLTSYNSAVFNSGISTNGPSEFNCPVSFENYIVLGCGNTFNDDFSGSVVIGANNSINGHDALINGNNNLINHSGVHIVGNNITSSIDNQVIFGESNITSSCLFVIADGANTGSRFNVLEAGTGSVDICTNLSLPGITNVSQSIADAAQSGGGGGGMGCASRTENNIFTGDQIFDGSTVEITSGSNCLMGESILVIGENHTASGDYHLITGLGNTLGTNAGCNVILGSGNESNGCHNVLLGHNHETNDC